MKNTEFWHVGDLDNGVLESFESYTEALEYYRHLIDHGIELEREVQYLTLLSDSEVSEKVHSYIFIIENKYYKL